MEKIKKIYYINLDHRLDRKELFLKEMELLGIPQENLIRVSAVYNKGFGIIGCCESHIKALELFLASGDDYTMIFEDDFRALVDKGFFGLLLKRFFGNQIPFDVLLLESYEFSKKILSEIPYLYRVTEGYGTGGYLITKEFAPRLLENFKQTKEFFYSKSDWIEGRYYTEICLDVGWHSLQKDYIFYLTNPQIGCQREGYSDIVNSHKPQNYKI